MLVSYCRVGGVAKRYKTWLARRSLGETISLHTAVQGIACAVSAGDSISNPPRIDSHLCRVVDSSKDNGNVTSSDLAIHN